MDEKQMVSYIDRYVSQQGNEGAIKLAPLLIAMVGKLFADPVAGITPIVATIAPKGKKVGTRTTYEVTTTQDMINGYIDYAFDEQERTRLFVEDKGALIGFTHIEIVEDSITGHVETRDGEFGLFFD